MCYKIKFHWKSISFVIPAPRRTSPWMTMENNLKQRHIPVKTVCMMRYSSNGCACLLCELRRTQCTWHSISNNYILILLKNITNQQALITTVSVIIENPQFVLTKLDGIYVEVCIRQVVGATGFTTIHYHTTICKLLFCNNIEL